MSKTKSKKSRGRRSQEKNAKLDSSKVSKKSGREKKTNTEQNAKQLVKAFYKDDTELKVYDNAESYEEKPQVSEEVKDDDVEVSFVVDGEGGDDDEEENNKNESESEKEDEADSDDGLEKPAFFGIVDRQELEYFKEAEMSLNNDAFGSSEERVAFTAGVFDEARGKELKLVTNQVCSKLIERLVILANPEQLKQIFDAFQGRFLQLSKHKFSSHCVETLLVRTAAAVEGEMLTPETTHMTQGTLKMVEELKQELLTLQKDKYASHVLRLVLLILAGQPLPSTTKTSKLRSKKSKIARKMISIKDNDDFEKAYQVPESFKKAAQQILDEFESKTDVTTFRELAIDSISSPLVQILVQVECAITSEKKRKTMKLPVLSKIFNADEKEEAFLEYLLSDPIGSHFLQACVEAAPLKFSERVYNTYMKDRIDKLARRDVAVFVIQSVIKKLRPREVEEILNSTIPDLAAHVEQHPVLARALIDAASDIDYKLNEITDAMLDIYKVDRSSTASQFLESFLKLDGSTLGNTKGDWPTAEEMHRSLLLQSLVKASTKCMNYTIDAFISMDDDRLKLISQHSVFSHNLEAVLDVTKVDQIGRRRLLNRLTDLLAGFACNAYGSHIVDKCWSFCFKLKHLREQIAAELVKNEENVKNSVYGRVVWRNWIVDKYVRQRHVWWKLVKEQEDAIAEKLGVPAKGGPPAAAGPAAHTANQKSGKATGKSAFSQRPKPYDKKKNHAKK